MEAKYVPPHRRTTQQNNLPSVKPRQTYSMPLENRASNIQTRNPMYNGRPEERVQSSVSEPPKDSFSRKALATRQFNKPRSSTYCNRNLN